MQLSYPQNFVKKLYADNLHVKFLPNEPIMFNCFAQCAACSDYLTFDEFMNDGMFHKLCGTAISKCHVCHVGLNNKSSLIFVNAGLTVTRFSSCINCGDKNLNHQLAFVTVRHSPKCITDIDNHSLPKYMYYTDKLNYLDILYISRPEPYTIMFDLKNADHRWLFCQKTKYSLAYNFISFDLKLHRVVFYCEKSIDPGLFRQALFTIQVIIHQSPSPIKALRRFPAMILAYIMTFM